MKELNMEEFFSSEGFIALDENSKTLLREFIQKTSGKSQAETMAVFMEYRGKLNVGEDKQKILIEALKAGLSPENRMRFEAMEKFARNYM